MVMMMHVVVVHMVVVVPTRWGVRLRRRQLRALPRTNMGIGASMRQRASRRMLLLLLLLLWLLNYIMHLLLLLLLLLLVQCVFQFPLPQLNFLSLAFISLEHGFIGTRGS
jgi:hypothetical protein